MHSTMYGGVSDLVLDGPECFVGSMKEHTRPFWVYENDKMVSKHITYVPALFNIFDVILVNAADCKRHDPKMDRVEVEIDQGKNLISVKYTGVGITVQLLEDQEGKFVRQFVCGQLRYPNIFSTEFVIETADGNRHYKQVFNNNMCVMNKIGTRKCETSETWTKITCMPDLERFGKTVLEDGVVALMKKRVVDLAGCLSLYPGNEVKVVLNGVVIEVKSFHEYAQLYLNSSNKSSDPLPRIDYSDEDDKNRRWQISVSRSDGQFQQVSFVNSINTTEGGTHVDYITNYIVKCVIHAVKKKDKNVNLEQRIVKNHLWVFVNALIDNPIFDSLSKETLKTRAKKFGTTCKLSDMFLKQVVDTSSVVESLLSWAYTKKKEEMDSPTEADLPSMADGLTSVQRKVLFEAFKENLVNQTNVAHFCGHCEANIQGAVIGMAQNFVGANNINLFVPLGQFGSRHMGGKDPANPVYLSTMLSKITRFLFPKEDDVLVNYMTNCEPIQYVPIIPMVLVNGPERTGTCWSTFYPSYNPRDIIANLKCLLNGEPVLPMDPWYSKFRGSIEKSALKDGTYTVYGDIKVVRENNEDVILRITELPIKMWTCDYMKFLHSLANPKDKTEKFIKAFRDLSFGNTICIEVVLTKRNYNIAKQEGLLEKFELTTTLSTRNIALFNEDKKFFIYETPEHILLEFYDLRLKYYTSRKENLLEIYDEELEKLKGQIRLIQSVLNRSIALGMKEKGELEKEFVANGIPRVKAVPGSDGYEYLLSFGIKSLTREKMSELENNVKEVKDKIEQLKNASERSLWSKDLALLEEALEKKEKGGERFLLPCVDYDDGNFELKTCGSSKKRKTAVIGHKKSYDQGQSSASSGQH